MKCEAINNDIEQLQETKKTNGASDEERRVCALVLESWFSTEAFQVAENRQGEVPNFIPRVDRPFLLRQSVSALAKK